MVPAACLAILFYHYSVFTLGLPLVAFFFLLLMMGWAVGLVITALIMRFGLGAESLAWIVMFALAPLSGVFYPISILPDWLQTVAWGLPSTYVFEGMRAVVFDATVRFDHLLWALALNMVYLAAAGAFFLHTFHVARQRGLLMGQGE